MNLPNPGEQSSLKCSTPSFLVTGAAGFIGHHLVRRLARQFGGNSVTAMVNPLETLDEAHRLVLIREAGVRVVECNLLTLNASTALQVPQFDVLYHLAGYAVTENASGPFEVNSLGTKNLIEWLGLALAGKRLIYTGTLASFDYRETLDPVTETTPCRPVTAYGKTKLEGENIVSEKALGMGYHHTILRLCTIIGPGFRPGGMFGVFPDMLRRQAFATRLNWPGKASFLNVSDLVDILVALPSSEGLLDTLYVVGNGETVSFDSLLADMADCLQLRRKSVPLPGWFWKCVLKIAWFGASSRWIGYKTRIFCWRVSHLCGNGLLADATKLNNRLGMRMKSLKESLAEIYQASAGSRS